MEYINTTGENKDFLSLCTLLDEELNRLVGGEANRAQYIPHNNFVHIHDVVLAYDGVTLVGCAALKVYGGETGEVKRVYVKPEYRGYGIGRVLIEHLEQVARKKGFQKLILETGTLLPAAMGLYRSLGFTIMANYGPYKDMPDSICMKKVL